jgi:hypothetical protein
MKNKKLKRWSLLNLITGYIMVGLFMFLVILNRSPEVVSEELVIDDIDNIYAEDIFDGVREDELKTDVIYVDGHPGLYTTRVVRDNSIGIDRSRGVLLDDGSDVIVFDDRDNDIYVDNDRNVNNIIRGHDEVHNRVITSGDPRGGVVVGRHGTDRVHNDLALVDDVVDVGLLDRRLANLRDDDLDVHDRVIREDRDRLRLDVDDGSINVGQLTLSRNDDDDIELGDVTDLDLEFKTGAGKTDYGVGKGGQLYAYNFPSRGVGAGIGSGGVGAGAGGSAGLGAGIGQGVLNGETVPTLGGVGTYSTVEVVPPGTGTDTDRDGLTAEAEALLGTDPQKADSDGDGFVDGAEISSYTDPKNPSSNPNIPGSESSPTLGGVGGLVGGAGAGGAAGLVTGMVKGKLGIGVGAGCAEHGGSCDGHHGHGGHADYDHLPKDGALHIMMHVDGSGSILDTRKQLTIMKDTLLKEALLPYYNNNEDLYNRRVMILDGNGERTLQFFTEAAKKDNVLALVFQDEAAPAYHLPTFNKKPQDQYSKDIVKLKASLNGYGGVYRGVMFQVDRGKTFAKSFKEFVESAWRGEGYLKTSNLKKYYRDNNTHHIKNKDGVVFSDEYHAADSGDPQYYLDLIFAASKKIGLDLDIYGAGITDGKYNKKIN